MNKHRYLFQKDFQGPILEGLKTFTFRQGDEADHASLGQILELVDPATDAPFAEARCILRAKVVFDRNGLHRVMELNTLGSADPLGRMLTAAESGSPQAGEYRERLAVMDGFPTWAALADWQAEHGVIAHGRCWRELIAFDNVTPIALPVPKPEPVKKPAPAKAPAAKKAPPPPVRSAQVAAKKAPAKKPAAPAPAAKAAPKKKGLLGAIGDALGGRK